MWPLVFGIASLCLFFVPLLPPLLTIIALLTAIEPFRSKRRRVYAAVGMACALLALALQHWVWTFGHLP